ncbi:MAG: hypothetical protein AAGB12_01805 [Pseudomonadota bacterium]
MVLKAAYRKPSHAIKFVNATFSFWRTILIVGLLATWGCSDVDVESVNEELVLDFETYKQQVNPIFNQVINNATCAASGCHRVNDGTGGSFRIIPGNNVSEADLMINYLSTSAFVILDDPENSPLLLEPLPGSSASVGGHAGGDFFEVGDENYTAILTWIQNPVAP